MTARPIPALSRLVVGWILVGLSACDPEGGGGPPAGTPAPFEGARWIELDCVKNGTVPTEAEVQTLLDALLEAYGGRERLLGLSYSTRGYQFARFGGTMSNRADRIVLFRPDDHMRISAQYRSGLEQTLLTGDRSYMAARALDLIEVFAENAVLVRWMYKTQDLPQGMVREGCKVTGLAPLLRDDGVQIPLRVEDANQPALLVFVSPHGPVIRRVESRVTFYGKESVQAVEFLELRRVEGILFPFEQRVYIDDNYTALTDLDEVVVGVDLPDDLFKP